MTPDRLVVPVQPARWELPRHRGREVSTVMCSAVSNLFTTADGFDGFADAMKGAFANDEDLSAIDDGRAPARAQAPRAAVGAAGGGGDDGARRLLDEIAEAAVARPRWTLEVLS